VSQTSPSGAQRQREQQLEEEVMREFRSELQGCEPNVTTAVQRDSELCQLLRHAGCD